MLTGVQTIDTSYDVIVAAVAGEDAETAAILWSYMEQGGTVIAYGNLQVMAPKLSALPVGNTGPGYYRPGGAYPKAERVRFHNARPWKVESDPDSDVIREGVLLKGQPNGEEAGDALQSFPVGSGSLDRWAVDVGETIVAFQQGSRPVWEDGFPAPDGSALVNEGILKADDQIELSWEWDRTLTETGNPYFAKPYGDYWREMVIGHLLKKVVSLGLTLPFIGYWPDGVEQVALLSHDSDINEDEHAWSTLELLKECGVKSTWCMLEPGYGPDVYSKVKEDGHELGFHYNALALDGGRWGEDEFNRQLDWLKEEAKLEKVTSNKNHYTRYEGWGEFYRWCEERQIEVDQTRGPSKKGNVGFLFGTCQPYFPISWADENNRLYPVLEIGFLTQDMDCHPLWADSSIIVPFLEGVREVEGSPISSSTSFISIRKSRFAKRSAR
ncbi:hypothetical protein N6H14_21200 [Paenibacillus sp. CC-CFT747]|nr:hypothetical protein N6H14_21200 [Paenibacillus sp. CC-CFT747]